MNMTAGVPRLARLLLITLLTLTTTLAFAQSPRDELLFTGDRLDREALIDAVLERNPGIEAARQAWQAAIERVPQVTSLPDPTVAVDVAPLTIGGGRFGQTLRGSQMVPFPGKLAAEGAMARAEALAMRNDYENVRLELALMASLMYDDYYTVDRALEINAAHQVLLRELRASAEAQYVVGRASQQDPLQAEVEMTMLEQEAIELATERRNMIARINALLHRNPASPLPPPVSRADSGRALPADSEELQALALESVPMLAAARAAIEASEAGLRRAKLDYFPDFDVMGSYNSMPMDNDEQFMVGIGINLPIRRERRAAAVREAEARIASNESRLARLEDEVRSEVQQAWDRVRESQQTLALFTDRLLPAARDQVAAARAGFVSGQNSFLAVIEAERNLRNVQLQLEVTLANLQRRFAQLDRWTGRIPFMGSKGVAS